MVLINIFYEFHEYLQLVAKGYVPARFKQAQKASCALTDGYLLESISFLLLEYSEHRLRGTLMPVTGKPACKA